jgi:ABC-type bacteriocin/lantibiotic exporter with double-glycine peptidase domain
VLYSQEKAKREKAMLEKTLLGAVWGTYSRPFLLGGIPKIVQDILSFASPFLVKTMYKYVDPMQGFDSSQHTWRNGLGICGVFFLVQYASSVALHLYFDRVFQVSLQIRAGLVACVYRKALRLSHASRSQKSLGELVNLMSVDVQRMTDLVPYLHNLIWSSPLQIVISMMLLYRLVGVASLVGLAVMIAVMPINAAILLKLRKLQASHVCVCVCVCLCVFVLL